MKCTVCFFCERGNEFYFCKCHNLEVFNPNCAGCNDGKRSLTLMIGNMRDKIIRQSDTFPAADIHRVSRISALVSLIQ